MKDNIEGFLLAAFAVTVWSTTFVATKYLLRDFSSLEIQFLRYGLAYLTLWLLYPRTPRITRGHEKYFMSLGLFGAALYQTLENCAIFYTNASNVSILVATAPVFTAILCRLLNRERLTRTFFPGCALALSGIALISFNGVANLHFNPLGDALALGCALTWGLYSLSIVRINALGYHHLFQIRRAFFWTIVFLLPLALLGPDFMDGSFAVSASLGRFGTANILSLLFLGIFASALSFVAWNKACQLIGTVRCTAGIYLSPVITILFAWPLLGEKPGLMSLGGVLLALLGVYLTMRR